MRGFITENDETAHRGDVICLTPGQQDIKRWLLTSGNLVLPSSRQLVELVELVELVLKGTQYKENLTYGGPLMPIVFNSAVKYNSPLYICIAHSNILFFVCFYLILC